MSCNIRNLPGTTACCSLAILALLLLGTTTCQAQHDIQFYDQASKLIVTVQADIEQETISGLRFRTSGRNEPVDVSTNDLIDVAYSVPGSLRLILARARNEEKKTLAPDATRSERLQAIVRAIKEYEDLLNQGQLGTLKAARRHWQFRMARLQAQAASEDPARRKRAIAALTDFLRESESWQTAPTTRLLAKCVLDGGDYEALTRIGDQAINRKELSPAAKRQQIRELIFWDCLAKSVQPASALLAAQKTATPPGSSEMVRVQALEAFRDAAQDKPENALGLLENLEKQTKEPADRSYLWLLRGFCETFAGRDDQALWAFLRVELLYGEDRVACARAVEQLIKLFEARSDWSRAAVYRVKLWRDFAG